jgi:hypothetical protein
MEGNSGLITVDQNVIKYILIYCETYFVSDLQSHVVFSVAELASEWNILPVA